MNDQNLLNQEVISMPRIGDTAPDFEAVTTKGNIKMSEFAKDKWTVMFSHPADFTPVCNAYFLPLPFFSSADMFTTLNRAFEKLVSTVEVLSVDPSFTTITSKFGWFWFSWGFVRWMGESFPSHMCHGRFQPPARRVRRTP